MSMHFTPAARPVKRTLGTPPNCGMELSDLSSKKGAKKMRGASNMHIDDENACHHQQIRSPPSRARGPLSPLRGPLSPLAGAPPPSSSTRTPAPREQFRTESSLPCTPVAKSSVTGEALLVPFGGAAPRSAVPPPLTPAKMTPTTKLSEALLMLGWGDSASKAPTAPATPVAQPNANTWLEIAARLAGENFGVYPALCAAGAPEATIAEQIEIDIVRTDLGDDSEQASSRRDVLRRVLHAFSRHDPATGYVQGMDCIAAAALIHVEPAATFSAAAALEERAFWWLVHASSTLLRGFFTSGMPALWSELSVLRASLLSIRPQLVAHLDGLGFDFALLAPSWYLTLFQRILDDAEVASTLTALTASHVEPTHIALGIVLTCESELLSAWDFDSAANALCGTVCASRTRRAPFGVLAHAMRVAALLPPKKLTQIRAEETAAGGLLGPGAAETPRGRQATRRWFESPWRASKK